MSTSTIECVTVVMRAGGFTEDVKDGVDVIVRRLELEIGLRGVGSSTASRGSHAKLNF